MKRSVFLILAGLFVVWLMIFILTDRARRYDKIATQNNTIKNYDEMYTVCGVCFDRCCWGKDSSPQEETEEQ